jgi:hypothetical protein
MNEATFENLLAAGRTLLGATTPEREPFPPGCLSFARARALALGATAIQAPEAAHLERCRRCTGLIGAFRAAVPHMPWWQMLRRRLGRLSAAEERAAAAHLEEEGCPACFTRWEALGSAREWSILPPGRLRLPDPAAAGAAAVELEVTARSANGELEADLVEEESSLSLEVRTKNPQLNHSLVGYTLLGAAGEGRLGGLLLLRPDVQGWFAARERFDAASVYATLHGACDELLISPLALDLLGSEEREQLLAAAHRSRHDPELRSTWLEWSTRIRPAFPSLGEETHELLQDLRRELGA